MNKRVLKSWFVVSVIIRGRVRAKAPTDSDAVLAAFNKLLDGIRARQMSKK